MSLMWFSLSKTIREKSQVGGDMLSERTSMILKNTV